MGDEQHPHPTLDLQFADQVQNLALGGDIQRRRRLIGDQQARVVGQGHGDHHPLALPAGKLERIGARQHHRVWQVDLREQLLHAGIDRRLIQRGVVNADRLGHLMADAGQRVQGSQRLLKDHGDVTAAQAAQLCRRQLQNIAPVKGHAAGTRPDLGRQQAQNGACGQRFARAAFTDKADNLIGRDRERDTVNRMGTVRPLRKGQHKVRDGEKGNTHAREILGLRASLSASPTRLMPTTVSRMARPGNTLIHQACRMTVRPEPII